MNLRRVEEYDENSWKMYFIPIFTNNGGLCRANL